MITGKTAPLAVDKKKINQSEGKLGLSGLLQRNEGPMDMAHIPNFSAQKTEARDLGVQD